MKIQYLNSSQVTPELIEKISNFYREIFANNGHYLVYPSTLKSVSPQSFFQRPAEQHIPLALMDSLKQDEFPKHPVTGEYAIYWHHPQKTIRIMKEKLESNAHIVLLLDDQRKINGLVFGNVCSLHTHWSSQEWENPIYYSQYIRSEHHRDFNTFLQLLNQKTLRDPEQFARRLRNGIFEAQTSIYTWNTFALSPEARGKRYGLKMLETFIRSIPQHYKETLINIGEAKYNSRAHGMFKQLGALDLAGYIGPKTLKKGDSVLLAFPLKSMEESLLSPQKV